MLTWVTVTDRLLQTEVARETGRRRARRHKAGGRPRGASKRRSRAGKGTARAARETPPKLGVEAASVAPKPPETLQGAMTGMAKGHLPPRPRNLQTNGIQKGRRVKRDLIKSSHLHTERLHKLTGMSVKTSGRTGEVPVSKEKVPMGRLIHIATSLPLVTTSKYREEVQLTGAKECPPVPHTTTGMPMATGRTGRPSHPVPTPPTRGSGLRRARRPGAGPRATADTVLLTKGSLLRVLMETAGGLEVHTESP